MSSLINKYIKFWLQIPNISSQFSWVLYVSGNRITLLCNYCNLLFQCWRIIVLSTASNEAPLNHTYKCQNGRFLDEIISKVDQPLCLQSKDWFCVVGHMICTSLNVLLVIWSHPSNNGRATKIYHLWIITFSLIGRSTLNKKHAGKVLGYVILIWT